MSESSIASSPYKSEVVVPTVTEVNALVTQLSEADLDPAVHRMITRLAEQEGPHFRHQLRQDNPLTLAEKVTISTALFRSNPGEFLARYSRYLLWPEDAECFQEHVAAGDFTVCHYLKQAGVDFHPISLHPSSSATIQRRQQMRVKNRRLQVLHRMLAECANDPTDGFFSHEEMRERDPELWESMVGRYLTTQDRRALLGHSYESFSGLLLSQLLESESAVQRQAAAAGAVSENEDEEMDEEFDSDDEAGQQRAKEIRQRRRKLKAVERERSKAEFVEIMQSRFLAGKDSNFDYRTVDNDESLDDEMEESWLDAEDSYFDAESPCQAEVTEENKRLSDDENDTDNNGVPMQAEGDVPPNFDTNF